MSIQILVVDDEEPIVFAVHEYFSARGYSVHCAHELEQAKTLVRTHSYDVVIADLRLTGTHDAEGLELISYIRESSSSPVILLTAYGSAEIERAAYERGANTVLQKPTPLSVLAQLVATVADQPRALRSRKERQAC